MERPDEGIKVRYTFDVEGFVVSYMSDGTYGVRAADGRGPGWRALASFASACAAARRLAEARRRSCVPGDGVEAGCTAGDGPGAGA